MLDTGERAGTIATRHAGSVEFHATLEWEEPPSSVPCCLPDPSGTFRYDLRGSLAPCGKAFEVTGTILAMTGRDLGSALELLMRSVGAAAAASGAVLETRAFRGTPPRTTPPDVLQALALDLWRAGFPVRFAPSWVPVPGGTVGLGFLGDQEGLWGFLRGHPDWDLP